LSEKLYVANFNFMFGATPSFCSILHACLWHYEIWCRG